MNNVSSTTYYRATSGSSPLSEISVAVVRSTQTVWLNEPEVRYDLDVSYFDSQGACLDSPQPGQQPPHLRANYFSRQKEVFIHNIERGCIARGQQFMAKTFTQVMEVSPEFQTFVLSNLSSRSIHAAGLGSGFDAEAMLEPVGVHLQSLFACGLRNIRAFHDGGSAYVGLRAQRQWLTLHGGLPSCLVLRLL